LGRGEGSGEMNNEQNKDLPLIFVGLFYTIFNINLISEWEKIVFDPVTYFKIRFWIIFRTILVIFLSIILGCFIMFSLNCNNKLSQEFILNIISITITMFAVIYTAPYLVLQIWNNQYKELIQKSINTAFKMWQIYVFILFILVLYAIYLYPCFNIYLTTITIIIFLIYFFVFMVFPTYEYTRKFSVLKIIEDVNTEQLKDKKSLELLENTMKYSLINGDIGIFNSLWGKYVQIFFSNEISVPELDKLNPNLKQIYGKLIENELYNEDRGVDIFLEEAIKYNPQNELDSENTGFFQRKLLIDAPNNRLDWMKKYIYLEKHVLYKFLEDQDSKKFDLHFYTLYTKINQRIWKQSMNNNTRYNQDYKLLLDNTYDSFFKLHYKKFNKLSVGTLDAFLIQINQTKADIKDNHITKHNKYYNIDSSVKSILEEIYRMDYRSIQFSNYSDSEKNDLNNIISDLINLLSLKKDQNFWKKEMRPWLTKVKTRRK